MPEKTLSRYLFISIASLLLIAVSVVPALAKSPVIIRYDAQMMDNEIRINLAWQSDEPIAKIITSAGRGQLIITETIENERNENGYSGEMNIVVPAYIYNATGEHTFYLNRQNSSTFQQSSMEMYSNTTSPQNEAVQYSVQLVDEVNQRSTLLKDKVRRLEGVGPQGGSRHLGKQSGGTVRIDTTNPVNTALNTSIALVGNKLGTPVVKNIQVKNWTGSRVSIAFEATGSKGIDSVAIEVRDASGNIANQSTVSCSSDKQCSKQSDPFSLDAGSYRASLIATDSESNKSPAREMAFEVTNGETTQQTAVSVSPQTSSSSSSSSSTGSSGVTYEKE